MWDKKWMTLSIWLEHACTLPSAKQTRHWHALAPRQQVYYLYYQAPTMQRTHYYNGKVDRNTSSRRPGWFLAWLSIHHTSVRLTQPFQTSMCQIHPHVQNLTFSSSYLSIVAQGPSYPPPFLPRTEINTCSNKDSFFSCWWDRRQPGTSPFPFPFSKSQLTNLVWESARVRECDGPRLASRRSGDSSLARTTAIICGPCIQYSLLYSLLYSLN